MRTYGNSEFGQLASNQNVEQFLHGDLGFESMKNGMKNGMKNSTATHS